VSLIQTCLVEVLVNQRPDDEGILRQCENLDDLLRYSEDNLTIPEVETVQSLLLEHLSEAHANEDNPIESAEFDDSTPLPIFNELELPRPNKALKNEGRFTLGRKTRRRELPNRYRILEKMEHPELEPFSGLIQTMYSFEKHNDEFVLTLRDLHDYIGWIEDISQNVRLQNTRNLYWRINETKCLDGFHSMELLYVNAMATKVDPLLFQNKKYTLINKVLSHARQIIMSINDKLENKKDQLTEES